MVTRTALSRTALSGTAVSNTAVSDLAFSGITFDLYQHYVRIVHAGTLRSRCTGQSRRTGHCAGLLPLPHVVGPRGVVSMVTAGASPQARESSDRKTGFAIQKRVCETDLSRSRSEIIVSQGRATKHASVKYQYHVNDAGREQHVRERFRFAECARYNLSRLACIFPRRASTHLLTPSPALTLLQTLHRAVTQAYAINRPYRSHF